MAATGENIMDENFVKTKPHDYLFLPIIKLLPKSIKPNHLSALRILMALPIILLMWLHFFKLCGCLFIFASILDALDGSMARLRDQETMLGKILDPTADKVVNITVFLGFLFYIKSNYYFGLILPILILDVILFQVALFKFIIKDIVSETNRIRYQIEIKATGSNIWGKSKMITQVIILSFLLLFDPKTLIHLESSLSIVPQEILYLHLTYPALVLCTFFSLKSLIGHVQVIKLKNND